MSVINQMLKDLDQRNPEVATPSAQTAGVTTAHSPMKIALITAISVLTICLLAFYVWQINSENNALKAQQSTQASRSLSAVQKPVAVVEVKSPPPARKALPEPVLESVLEKVSAPVSKPSPQQNYQPSKAIKARPNIVVSNETPIAPAKPARTIKNNSSSKVTPAKQEKVMAHTDDHTHEEGSTLSHSHKKTETNTSKPSLKAKSKAKTRSNKMSVSRRQLSAEDLAQQKLAQVEKALASKQISKAEKLLEDVVIITPNDSQARKKLAALWFGRQAYQDAVNILSQGIALNGKDSSLRQMKARIHLKQGQARAALNTLKPLAQLEDEQYQIMLANTAQQAQHHKSAVDAYKMLISMRPDIGRWQLGLAVLYDKNSQFNLASKAYKEALTKNDLSVSSEQFVQERIQALGQ